MGSRYRMGTLLGGLRFGTSHPAATITSTATRVSNRRFGTLRCSCLEQPRSRCVLAKPVVESGRTETGPIARHEVALTQEGAEVPSLRIDDDDALIPLGAQPLADEVPEPQRLGSTDLDHRVQGSTERDV